MDRAKMGATANVRILFIDRGEATYIRSDLDLLTDFSHVHRLSFRTRSFSDLPFALMRQFFACWKGMAQCDILFVHFAGWNSWVPLAIARMRNRPSVLFIHGTDSVSMPSIDYGNFRKWPLSAVTRGSLRLANRIVAVSDALVQATNSYTTGEATKQGILSFVHPLDTPIEVLPHGFDPAEWPYGDGPRDIDVLTVGSGLHAESTRKLKGVDLLISAARRMPDRVFAVAGMEPGDVRDLPPNFKALGNLTSHELAGVYQRAKCYAQLSLSEGFGCALAEAMLCGAVPVVSNVGVMPIIIGEAGRVLNRPSLQDLLVILGEQLDAPDLEVRSYSARQEIISKYPRSARRAGLKRLAIH